MRTPLPSRLPPSAGLPAPGLWLWLAALGMLALGRLARARWHFGRLTMQHLQHRNAAARAHCAPQSARDAVVLAYIAYLLPRAARILPFRSDCLVQALAGQDWLADEGLAGIIRLGVEHGATGFGAHAWLTCGDQTITGDEGARYAEVFGDQEATHQARDNAMLTKKPH